ncbi:hypothetical protein FKP32DRAFT_678560 [Trametes sanguinea]|nr:hypothetical protein FKP32DRAFT_678560 [Trametes sanguinea]
MDGRRRKGEEGGRVQRAPSDRRYARGPQTGTNCDCLRVTPLGAVAARGNQYWQPRGNHAYQVQPQRPTSTTLCQCLPLQNALTQVPLSWEIWIFECHWFGLVELRRAGGVVCHKGAATSVRMGASPALSTGPLRMLWKPSAANQREDPSFLSGDILETFCSHSATSTPTDVANSSDCHTIAYSRHNRYRQMHILTPIP